MKIEISDETVTYLANWLYAVGAEAWYTEQIEMDLTHYDGAIKDMANHISFLRALADERLDYDPPFETTISRSSKSGR